MDKETPKIYYPPEKPEEKNTAKAAEKEAIKKREREPRSMSLGDLEATVADAEKAKKMSRGIMEGEFKDWWLGKKGGEGAKKLAKWVFEYLAIYRDLFWNWQEGGMPKESVSMSGMPDFFKAVEPNLRQLIEGEIKHGGQEHVAQYFWDEWAPEYNKDAVEKVWKIYQKYLDDIGGKV